MFREEVCTPFICNRNIVLLTGCVMVFLCVFLIATWMEPLGVAKWSIRDLQRLRVDARKKSQKNQIMKSYYLSHKSTFWYKGTNSKMLKRKITEADSV